jgi:hypothetical protein
MVTAVPGGPDAGEAVSCNPGIAGLAGAKSVSGDNTCSSTMA